MRVAQSWLTEILRRDTPDWGVTADELDAGFVRVHRSYLVRIAAITEARLTGGEPVVVVADAPPVSIPVSRRMLPAVRESLVRAREAGR